MGMFLLGTKCGAIIFALATDTTISFHLGKQYEPLFCQSFLDVYGDTA
jgi:hypothetical protein